MDIGTSTDTGYTLQPGAYRHTDELTQLETPGLRAGPLPICVVKSI